MLDIEGVARSQLCSGCGACAAVSPERYKMVDAIDFGRRPLVVGSSDAAAESRAMAACPGARLEHTFDVSDPDLLSELRPAWGPVYEVWEGWAVDDDLRWSGSSGGAASALSLYCLERGGMPGGVLHTGARKDVPYLNETVLSMSRRELLSRAGSRYAPASPCDGLGRIAKAQGPCVFVGKPCDAAAAQAARASWPALDANLGAVIAFFCAGSPSTRGTLELLKREGIPDPSRVDSLRFRGQGWPGLWRAKHTKRDGSSSEETLTYAESWGFLQRYRQWRCYICPDHTGEFADIAVGDPWYRDVQEGEPGSSLIVARTRRGREIVRGAADAGYLHLERSDASLLARSQPNLLVARGSLWGRLLSLRIVGAPVPSFRGFPMLRFWFGSLSWKQRAQSLYGTFKRVGRKGLKRPVSYTAWSPAASAVSSQQESSS